MSLGAVWGAREDYTELVTVPLPPFTLDARRRVLVGGRKRDSPKVPRFFILLDKLNRIGRNSVTGRQPRDDTD